MRSSVLVVSPSDAFGTADALVSASELSISSLPAKLAATSSDDAGTEEALGSSRRRRPPPLLQSTGRLQHHHERLRFTRPLAFNASMLSSALVISSGDNSAPEDALVSAIELTILSIPAELVAAPSDDARTEEVLVSPRRRRPPPLLHNKGRL